MEGPSRSRSFFGRPEDLSFLGRGIPGLRKIGHVDQIDGRGGDVGLRAGLRAMVARRHRLQGVRLRVVDIDALGQDDEDVDLLPVARGRRGAASVGTSHAEGRPQQVRQRLRRQRIARKHPRGLSRPQHVHECLAAFGSCRRQLNRLQPLAGRQDGRQQEHDECGSSHAVSGMHEFSGRDTHACFGSTPMFMPGPPRQRGGRPNVRS